ncbi:MAG TPA: hypothetical protein VET48_04970 [Steroidobacteraceae bacterium]|nr:hypothetical protein [Steroidobacteraceae bacterium]
MSRIADVVVLIATAPQAACLAPSWCGKSTQKSESRAAAFSPVAAGMDIRLWAWLWLVGDTT